MQNHAIPCNTMQYNAMTCYTMQYHVIPCNTMQYHAIPCNTMQYHGTLMTADGAYHCPVGSIMAIFSSVRSSYSHPDLLLIHPPHPTTPFFQITPVLNTGLSLSEPLQLYKGYNALSRAIDGLNVLASWMPHGFDWASIMMAWGHLGHYLGMTWG